MMMNIINYKFVGVENFQPLHHHLHLSSKTYLQSKIYSTPTTAQTYITVYFIRGIPK